jgi:hypothetical protein
MRPEKECEECSNPTIEIVFPFEEDISIFLAYMNDHIPLTRGEYEEIKIENTTIWWCPNCKHVEHRDP